MITMVMLLRGCLIVGGNYKTIIIVFRSPQIIDRPNASCSPPHPPPQSIADESDMAMKRYLGALLPHLLLDCVPRRPSCTAPPSPRHSILALLQHFFPRLKSLVHSFILSLVRSFSSTRASALDDKCKQCQRQAITVVISV